MPDAPESSTPSVPPLGRNKVGRYEVLFPLAQGGMASVYVGRLSGMAGFQRLVAIKIIHPHLVSEKDFVKMFLDEARLAAGIHHPNVGEILEVGKEDNLFFMVGELVLGQSLLDVVRRTKYKDMKIPMEVSAAIVSHVCLGLHAAHNLKDIYGEQLNLVHRDVSPRNILISYDGFVKLIDFGVAHAKGRLAHTEAGTLKGKIGYMAPEQIRGERMDQRSDLFSVGVVLYRMVSGRIPFPGKSEGERLNKILQGKFVRPSQINPNIDSQLEEIVVKAMAHSPDDRYPTAAEMNADLENYVRSSGFPTGPTELSELMRELFEEEFELMQIKLRDFSDNANLTETTTPSSPPPTEKISLAPAEKRISDSPTSAMIKTSSDTQAPKAFGGARLLVGVAAAFLIALAVILGFTFRNGQNPDSVRPMSDGEGTVKPSADQQESIAATPASSDDPSLAEPRLVQLSLDITPDNATVMLDDKKLAPGTTQVDLERNTVEHQLEVSAPNYESVSQTFIATESRTIALQLRPIVDSKAKKNKGKKNKGKNKGKFGLKESPY